MRFPQTRTSSRIPPQFPCRSLSARRCRAPLAGGLDQGQLLFRSDGLTLFCGNPPFEAPPPGRGRAPQRREIPCTVEAEALTDQDTSLQVNPERNASSYRSMSLCDGMLAVIRQFADPRTPPLRSGEARSAVLVPGARRAMIRRERSRGCYNFVAEDEGVSSLEDASKGRRHIGFRRAGFLRVAVRWLLQGVPQFRSVNLEKIPGQPDCLTDLVDDCNI